MGVGLIVQPAERSKKRAALSEGTLHPDFVLLVHERCQVIALEWSDLNRCLQHLRVIGGVGLCKSFQKTASASSIGRNTNSLVSVIENRMAPGSGSSGSCDDPQFRDGPAVSGEFDRVADEVDEDLVQSIGISDDAVRDVRERRQASSRPFSLACMARISDGFFNQVAQIKVG